MSAMFSFSSLPFLTKENCKFILKAKKPYFSTHNPMGELGRVGLEDEETITVRSNSIYRVQNLITNEG